MRSKLLNSIRKKIVAGFTLIIVLVTALGVYNYISIQRVNKDTEKMLEEQVQLLIANTQIANSVSNGLRVTNSYLLTGDTKYKDQFDDFQEQGIHYAEHMQKVLGPEAFDPTGVDLAQEWRSRIRKEVFEEYDRGSEASALRNLEALDTLGEESIESFSHWVTVGEDEINATGKGIIQNGRSTLTMIVLITSLFIVISLIIEVVTIRMIRKPLAEVKNRMELIAAGDLSNAPLISRSDDEIGDLIAASNDMQETTRELLHSIRHLSGTVTEQSGEFDGAAREVREGTEQMASTMQELSSGAENQAHTTSSLSETMEAFSTKISTADQNGEFVREASAGVLDMTREGHDRMVSSTAQMEKIDQIVMEAVKKVEGLDVHSQKISELVLIIKGLAEQTNLLALNAAIEAARAGEHGKGFAVVAEEVRKLAEQSSSSVTNITEIVHQIQQESTKVVESLQNGYEEVARGTEEIAATNQTFGEISAAVSSMGTEISSVSENLAEILLNSRDMTNAIQEIAAISEESAAGIEETSAASLQIGQTMEHLTDQSKDLAHLATELDTLVSRFKL